MPKKTTAKKTPKMKKDGTASHQGQGGGAPIGSENAKKFKTPAERKIVFLALLKHLEHGLDQDSFEHCDWITVKTYIADYPEEFIPDDIARARRLGRQVIEKLLFNQALGKTKGQAAAAIFLAKNKLRYVDRVQLSGDPDNPVSVTIVDDLK